MRIHAVGLTIGFVLAAACGGSPDEPLAGSTEVTVSPEPIVPARSPDADAVGDAAPLTGILTRLTARDPSWPDSVGRLLHRRLDDPEVETIENFLLYLPPGFPGAEEEWPVLYYFHGRSLRGDDLDRVKRYGIPSLIERGYHLPFIVVAPQLPAGHRWVDVDRMWKLLEDAVLDRYPVDEKRIYATGFSMGAGGTWRFAVAHADELAAAIPVSATTPPPSKAWADALEDLPMIVYHGDADEIVPYESAFHMVRYLRGEGVPIHLVTIDGGSHSIVEQVYRDPELYLWLLAHER